MWDIEDKTQKQEDGLECENTKTSEGLCKV